VTVIGSSVNIRDLRLTVPLFPLGKFGRLGHGTERNCHTPRLVESLLGKRPRQVACGGFHTAVVTDDGRMYTFGGKMLRLLCRHVVLASNTTRYCS
jgi:alpha-tubulin suppressor-like RCC1 family protein